jgi:hypothetical protein
MSRKDEATAADHNGERSPNPGARVGRNWTVHDLVEAIRLDEEHRFDPDAIWQGSLRRAQRRTVRRRTATAVGAGVAVAVAAILPFAVRASRSAGPEPGTSSPAAQTATPPPTSTRPVLSSRLRAGTSGVWVIAPAATGAYLQTAYVRRVDQTKAAGTVEVYEPRAFDPRPVLGGTLITVDGIAAYVTRTENPFSGGDDGQHRTVEPTIAWRYAPDAWAVVRGAFDEDALRQVAGAVRIGTPEPVRLPFRVGFRPPGLAPVNVVTYEAAGRRRVVEYDHAGAPQDWRAPYRHLYLPLRIGMSPAIAEQWNPDTTVGGHPAMRNGPNEFIIARGDQWITIGGGPRTTPLSTDEIERIFTGLTFADWNDQATWFDAGHAA